MGGVVFRVARLATSAQLRVNREIASGFPKLLPVVRQASARSNCCPRISWSFSAQSQELRTPIRATRFAVNANADKEEPYIFGALWGGRFLVAVATYVRRDAEPPKFRDRSVGRVSGLE